MTVGLAKMKDGTFTLFQRHNGKLYRLEGPFLTKEEANKAMKNRKARVRRKARESVYTSLGLQKVKGGNFWE